LKDVFHHRDIEGAEKAQLIFVWLEIFFALNKLSH